MRLSARKWSAKDLERENSNLLLDKPGVSPGSILILSYSPTLRSSITCPVSGGRYGLPKRTLSTVSPFFVIPSIHAIIACNITGCCSARVVNAKLHRLNQAVNNIRGQT